MIKIGITGNIASGKSEVEKILSQEGFKVLDLDKVAHDILDFNKEAKNKIFSIFQTTDRKELSDIIFYNSKKKSELEGVLHPIIKKEVFNYLEKYDKEKAVFVSGALLFEAGFDKLFDKIIIVCADKKIRLERLKKRNNFNEIEALARINSQSDECKNAASSHFIITNDGDIDSLKKQVLACIKEIF